MQSGAKFAEFIFALLGAFAKGICQGNAVP
jgi:hypothetical protein